MTDVEVKNDAILFKIKDLNFLLKHC